MRWIFRYNETAAKYVGRILKKKMPEPQPWMHIAVKTMSNRNPWCGAVIFVWDTRKVLWEYRSQKDMFTTDMFKIANSGMTRANDNRQPLVGGRKDINEFFEFGDFDASHSDVFDGKDRVKITPLYKKRAAKAGIESYKRSTDFRGLRIVKPIDAIRLAQLKPSTLKSAEAICPVETVYKFYEKGDLEQRNAFGVPVTVIAQTKGSWLFTMKGVRGEFVARKQGKNYTKTVDIDEKDVMTIDAYAREIDNIDDERKRLAEMREYRELHISDEDAETAQNARSMSDAEFYEWHTSK